MKLLMIIHLTRVYSVPFWPFCSCLSLFFLFGSFFSSSFELSYRFVLLLLLLLLLVLPAIWMYTCACVCVSRKKSVVCSIQNQYGIECEWNLAYVIPIEYIMFVFHVRTCVCCVPIANLFRIEIRNVSPAMMPNPSKINWFCNNAFRLEAFEFLWFFFFFGNE